MVFDPCPHQITQVIIKAAILRRKELGLPEENNITTLYKELAPLLGIPIARMTSGQVDHLPSPSEMKGEGGNFVIPRKDCPKCGTKDGKILISLCPSCKDSEGGKYHSAWKCMTRDCDEIEKSEKFLTQVLSEMGIEFQSGSKKEAGIQTLTDDGLK